MLDILRLVIRDENANMHFCDLTANGPHLVDYACAVFSNSLTAQPKNQLLMLRALCNAFQHAAGKQLMLTSGERLLASSKVTLHGGPDKLLQVHSLLSSFFRLTIWNDYCFQFTALTMLIGCQGASSV